MGHFYLGYYTLIACRAVNKTKLIGRNCLLVRFHEILRFAQNDIFIIAPVTNNLKKPERDIEMSDKKTPLEQQP